MNVMTINFCHRDFPINYGQTLLGYALYKNIQKCGHNPISVSYLERNNDAKMWYLTRLLTPDKKTFSSKSFSATTEFVKNNMKFVPCFSKKEVYEISSLCNAWIVGGDVVWRKAYLGEIFTLDFGSPSVRRISYSPSIYGFDEADEDFFKGEFSKINRNLDFISFREEGALNIFKQLTGRDNVFNAIDPVLLERKEDWYEIAKPLENVTKEFVVIYIFGNPEEYKDFVENIKSEYLDKQIVVVPTSEAWANMYSVTEAIGVEEFIWLFSKTSFVITNSFHGVAFALEFEKQFYICSRLNMPGEGRDFRITEILKRVGVKERITYTSNDDEKIDYKKVSERIEQWRKKSFEFLRNSLSEEAELKFPKVYAVKNRNEQVRFKSSSGGAFHELAMEVINDGGIVFGAEWDEDFRVRHTSISSIEEIDKLMKSKYVQSHLGDTYVKVENQLKAGKKVLFTGTPCQIYGLRKYINNQYSDKLVCMGIMCHGTPKAEVWNSYLSSLEKENGKTKEVIFRDKANGWKDWNIVFKYEKNEYLCKWNENQYYLDFLENRNLMESCFNCKAKYHLKNIDILIGDFWRYKSIEDGFDDDKGLSAVTIFSEEGNKLWKKIENKFDIEESDFSTLSNLQWHLEHSAIKPT